MARRHGTLYCYTQGCRRPECRAAKNAHQRARVRNLAYGKPTTDLVDAEPVRRHVLQLKEDGFSLEAISDYTGVTRSALQRLIYGIPSEGRLPVRRMNPSDARALLATVATLDTLPDYAPVDVSGTRRRALGLAFNGLPLSWQADQLGYAATYYRRRVMGSEQVSAGMARRVRALHDEHWDTPLGESSLAARVRKWAVSQGGLPSAAWDDDLIDLPEDELRAECARRVATWDRAELAEAYRAHVKKGDRSPLMVAGASEYKRRQRASQSEHTAAA